MVTAHQFDCRSILGVEQGYPKMVSQLCLCGHVTYRTYTFTLDFRCTIVIMVERSVAIGTGSALSIFAKNGKEQPKNKTIIGS